MEIPRLLKVSEAYDVVSGSRFCAGGRMVDNAHYLASMLYNWFVRVVIRTQIQEYIGAGISHFMLWFLDIPDDAGMTLFAEQVAPLFRNPDIG